MDDAFDATESEDSNKITELEEEAAKSLAALAGQLDERLAAADAAIDADIATMRERAATLLAAIEEVGEKKAPRKMFLQAGRASGDDIILAVKGENLPKNAVKTVTTESEKRVTSLENSRHSKRTAGRERPQEGDRRRSLEGDR